MGLIKAALIGGVAYWAIKSSTKDKDEGSMAQRNHGGCGWGQRSRTSNSNTNEAHGGLSDGNERTLPGPYEPALNPPSYSTGAANAYYHSAASPYSADEKKQIQGNAIEYQTQAAIEPSASPPYQQMTFVKPVQPYRVSDMGQYRNRGLETGVTGRGQGDVSRADMVVEQAMMHLQSGQTDKARELLGRAMQS